MREKQKDEFKARCNKMRDETSRTLKQIEPLKVEYDLKELSQAAWKVIREQWRRFREGDDHVGNTTH